VNFFSQMPNYLCSLPYPHTQRIFDFSLHHYTIVIEINWFTNGEFGSWIVNPICIYHEITNM
jgi:hypothetical protein